MNVFKYILVLALLSHSACLSAQSTQDNWHQWRGPNNTGVSTTATPPFKWSETENIQWKVAIDGSGSSTPIVWGNRVFILTAINTQIVDPKLPKPEDQPMRVFGIKHPNTQYQLVVICLDRETGDGQPSREFLTRDTMVIIITLPHHRLWPTEKSIAGLGLLVCLSTNWMVRRFGIGTLEKSIWERLLAKAVHRWYMEIG